MALVPPPGVVTVTFTLPAAPAGAIAVSFWVGGDTSLTEVPAAVPNWTLAAATKFVPVTVTWLAPANGPSLGLAAGDGGGGRGLDGRDYARWVVYETFVLAIAELGCR